MSTTPERKLARLRTRFETRAQELAQIGFLLKGSVVKTRRRCSSPGCGCQSDPEKMHGPYWQWTGKIDGKMTTRALTEDQVSRYRQWMNHSKRFQEVVDELYALSAEANEILRTQERQSAETPEGAPRRPARG
jgi:hypothetical protein